MPGLLDLSRDLINTIQYCIDMDGTSSAERKPGRARDPDMEAPVWAVAGRHLSSLGYEAMSLAAVAHEAGTTRQALYRRWPDKASLAADALLAAAEAQPGSSIGQPAGRLQRRTGGLPAGGLAARAALARRHHAPGRHCSRGPGALPGPGHRPPAGPHPRHPGTCPATRDDRRRRRPGGGGLAGAPARGTPWHSRASPRRETGQPAAALVWRAVGGIVPPDGSAT